MERRGDTTGIGAETSQLPNRRRDDLTGPDLQQSRVRFGGARIADMPRPQGDMGRIGVAAPTTPARCPTPVAKRSGVRVNPTTPNFDAQYAVASGSARIPGSRHR
ncbi:hypothetical protein C8259_23900 [Nocardia nova]|uniref:Uncharacterized protein n=1 Tax=Nocardia nova TaxID=37330 RepID=A0A2T2YXC3_9NOCA|nr:hypothetical protein C8259_23900 [Nocardia nova]